jgi:hypothetical protein
MVTDFLGIGTIERLLIVEQHVLISFLVVNLFTNLLIPFMIGMSFNGASCFILKVPRSIRGTPLLMLSI